jgi:hypothetical protein
VSQRLVVDVVPGRTVEMKQSRVRSLTEHTVVISDFGATAWQDWAVLTPWFKLRPSGWRKRFP